MVLSILIAASMSLVSLYLIWKIKTGAGLYFSLYLSGMMLAMNGLALSLLNHRLVFIAILLNAAYMSLGATPIIMGKKISGRVFILLFSTSMALSEFLMGGVIVSIMGVGQSSLISWIDNPWFTAVMAAEMLFSVAVVMDKASRKWSPKRSFALALTLIMIVTPTTFPEVKVFFNVTVWISSVLMILSTVLIYETLYRQRLRKTQDTVISLELMIIFLVMMAGLFTVFVYGNWIILSASMVIGMIWVIFRTCGGDPSSNTSYTRNPRWAFTFIFVTFVMEWFMGAALDFASGTFSPGVDGFIGSLSLPWLYSGVLAPFWNLMNLFVSVTASVWFLVMMGTEMGLLAISKITVSKNRENKTRLALMVSAFVLYTIYLPSFSPWAGSLIYVPYMWSMGIGTLGPAAASVLLTGIIGTYAVSAAVSFMFGSRQICSVTCMAPVMYQGTFYDSLKVYNRSSNLGKKTLTSRLKPWFSVIVISVSVFVLISAVVSYLNSAKVISFSILGTDISTLVYTLWFNLLWYIVFVSIPFMGSYACVTQGWCYWGTFNQFISRLGLFRLKVKSSDTCLSCKTVDCASACPVGLTDMRGPFVEKGYFKSFKCIGVGDCIEACPYDNIFVYDVRHYLKDKISRTGNSTPKRVVGKRN